LLQDTTRPTINTTSSKKNLTPLRIFSLWCPNGIRIPLQSGGEYLGERCQKRIEKASIPSLLLELGSYGSIKTPAFSTDRPQMFKLLYKPSNMNRIPGLLVVLRAV